MATWVIKRIESTVDKLLPGKISSTLDEVVQRWLSGIKEALDEGRRVMGERESELRTQLQRTPVEARPNLKVR